MALNTEELAQQNDLIQQLLKHPACFGGNLDQAEHIETHISHLILTGETVYKIKKPINLGFVDFSTLEKRRLCCEEELRLNQRLAPTLYLDVVGIGGSIEHPQLNATDSILEYAVKMRRFRQQDLLSQTLPDREMIKCLAELVADFHQKIPAASEDMPYGKPENILNPMQENFQLIRGIKQPLLELERLNSLQTWTEQQAGVLEALMQERSQSGHIRECHGDLHLGNITIFEGQVTPFDGIEFNPNLRWIDTLSDIAFLIMDLQHRGLNPAAVQLLNIYLEQSGDYAGLPLLRFYLLYRAMVRAKVTAIRAFQEGLSYGEREQLLVEYRSFLSLAESITRHPPASLIITHGFSGSGKSTISGWLAEQLMAIRLRSDIERKRLFPDHSVIEGTAVSERYSDKATHVTYSHLMGMAKQLLRDGFSVVIDATFLAQWQREMFLQMAESQQAPILIIDCQASETLLYDRIKHRSEQGGDPSEADLTVLMDQQQNCEPLTSYERERTVTVDSEQFPPHGLLATVLQRLMR